MNSLFGSPKVCLEQSLIGVNLFPSSGNTSSICSFFFDEFIIWFTKREISVCRFWSCSSACFGIPSNRWSISGSNLNEFFLVAQDLSRLMHKRGFLVVLCEDFLFVEILLIYSRRISASVLYTIYQTNCQSWTTQYHDRSIDGLPKVQSLVLCESQIKSMYSIVQPSPFQFYGISLGPICSKRGVSVDVAMGPTDVNEACLSSFSNSDPSCSEISFTHWPVLKRWSHVLNVIGPSARTKHNVLQSWINLLPSWMTLNWSHVLDFDCVWRDNFSNRILSTSMITPRYELNEPRKIPYNMKWRRMYNKSVLIWFATCANWRIGILGDRQ